MSADNPPYLTRSFKSQYLNRKISKREEKGRSKMRKKKRRRQWWKKN